ncbi:sterol regulatory element-binding protein cleavage-activating protein [Macrosteles quadrilineatus]|uniref:sterol regulatory element-binding protein cleavage-activating protein n=1 Tax=Macrosteles quadrilineatus TaxID=74068 RepID=UPI0023E2441D|nr:sterol regulatory element-binding protein cleavage-activating protein [Macrosteles quadrilineatus]
MANPRWAETSVPRSLPERVAQLYYSHGLLCATYPFVFLFVTVTLVLICSYPLLSLPLPGNLPQHYSASFTNNSAAPEVPRWLLSSSPICYIQQVVMKTAVFPWTEDLKLTDAFRAPLAEVFPLLEAIQNYQDPNRSLTLGDVCMHVETARSPENSKVLPQYSCLLLSPANLWQLDMHRYHDDTNLINTIYNHQNLQKGKISLAELLFGLNLKDTGIKRYPLRKRQRIIQFAVTLVYLHYEKSYVDGLRERLSKLYPLHQNHNSSGNDSVTADYFYHVYYPGEFGCREFVPLVFTYLVLFFYIYFSVRKIELVHSKVGIALSAVFTVIASLLMSAGICFFFGLDMTGSGRGREVFPYLVVIIGLENVLVLTKSVVSTPPHLDVKIRIAQGLAREGWSITKNLLTEVTILTVGLLTLVPAIQEFCIFAIVGLLCDFFLQCLLYCTVLAIDVRRKEKIEPSQLFYHHYRYNPMRSFPMTRSHSVPRLSYPTSPPKMPKRIQLVHFWARTRIVQRAFMLCMVVWIGGIMYSADVLHKILPLDSTAMTVSEVVPSRYASPLAGSGGRKAAILEMEAKLLAAEAAHRQSLKEDKGSDELSRLKPGDYNPVQKLSPHHWAAILSLYNSTFLSGGYVTMLPPVQLASAVSPERAIAQRNDAEKQNNFQWQSLAIALDPIDFNDGEFSVPLPSPVHTLDMPFFPSSPMELFLTAVLCIISVLVLSYTTVVLYRCICSRNYAEWRASWMGTKEPSDPSSQVVLEAVPLVLAGHAQPIECLATDGHWLVSSCLGGHIKVWDSVTGDLVTTIRRAKLSPSPLQSTDEDSLYKELDTVCSRIIPGSRTTSPNCVRQSPSRTASECEMPTENEFKFSLSDESLNERTGKSFNGFDSSSDTSPIWCLDCQDNLIVIGCASGHLEIWDAMTGKKKCVVRSEESGVTCVRLAGHHIIAARLSGSLDFFQLECSNHHFAHRRTHVRTGSAGTVPEWSYIDSSGGAAASVKCVCLSSLRAHQQPITVLDFEGGRVLTGSQDHTLKVFSVADQAALFTLHGHFGPITSLFIDRVTPSTGASGSQDGLLCVWDLHTGACMYSIQAHDGVITCLTYSASYIISLGSDERLCVWERFQGHLLNTIQVVHTYCCSMVMLTHNLLITSRQGSLVVWDVCSGEPVRIVKLGHSDSCVFVHQIVLLNDSVACDYGQQLRVVRFPMVHDKMD